METKFVKKVSDFTADFMDGIHKVFSSNATLHITVEYGDEVGAPTAAAPAKKTRGRKPGVKAATAAAPSVTPGKKRGRKPGYKKAVVAAEVKPAGKKRGRKPKNATEA